MRRCRSRLADRVEMTRKRAGRWRQDPIGCYSRGIQNLLDGMFRPLMSLVPARMSSLCTDMRTRMRPCQSRRRASSRTDRSSWVSMTSHQIRRIRGRMMRMTIRMGLVFSIPGHMTRMTSMFSTPRDVSFMMMLRASSPRWASGMTRRSAQRGRRGESTEMEMSGAWAVTMRVSASMRRR
jgi:hypothetical protein